MTIKTTASTINPKSPIYRYALKKGVRDAESHDVLLDILKAGRAGKTVNKIAVKVGNIRKILKDLKKKGVVTTRDDTTYVGVYAAAGDVLVTALRRVVAKGQGVITYKFRTGEQINNLINDSMGDYRKGEPEDHPDRALYTIYHDEGDEWGIESGAVQYPFKGGFGYAAYDGKKPIGWAIIASATYTDIDDPKVPKDDKERAYRLEQFVMPDYRQKQIARTMVEKSLKAFLREDLDYKYVTGANRYKKYFKEGTIFYGKDRDWFDSNIKAALRRVTAEEGYTEPPARPPEVLYHVTDKKNLVSIKAKGLEPRVGSVTRSGHGDETNPATPLVYLLDKPANVPGELVVTVDPAANDVWYFTGQELIELGPNGWGQEITEGDFPVGIEPGDYFSEVAVEPMGYQDRQGGAITFEKFVKSVS